MYVIKRSVIRFKTKHDKSCICKLIRKDMVNQKKIFYTVDISNHFVTGIMQHMVCLPPSPE